MRGSKLMKSRIRRVQVVLKELGYDVYPGIDDQGVFSGEFADDKGFRAFYSIDPECRFVEFIFTFEFSDSLAEFLKTNIEEVLTVCYETGTYVRFEKPGEGFGFAIFAKVYYSGLSYSSVKDTLYDFKDCVVALSSILCVSEGKDA
jgi:hypothetical protein